MIELKGISKSYDGVKVYENFDLQIENGKITVILGESGSGKTTLLNMLAGLTDYSGKIEGTLKPVSLVFQKDRLISNLTVQENLALVNAFADTQKILEEYGLTEKAHEFPKNLSGGQARRVAIARALCVDAQTILMDEPFINLDVKLKFRLIDKIKEKQKSKGSTVITVTHDVKEAVSLADRIIVLSNGRVVFDEKNVNEKTENKIFGLMIKGFD